MGEATLKSQLRYRNISRYQIIFRWHTGEREEKTIALKSTKTDKRKWVKSVRVKNRECQGKRETTQSLCHSKSLRQNILCRLDISVAERDLPTASANHVLCHMTPPPSHSQPDQPWANLPEASDKKRPLRKSGCWEQEQKGKKFTKRNNEIELRD